MPERPILGERRQDMRDLRAEVREMHTYLRQMSIDLNQIKGERHAQTRIVGWTMAAVLSLVAFLSYSTIMNSAAITALQRDLDRHVRFEQQLLPRESSVPLRRP